MSKPFQVEGVDYSPEGIERLRQDLTQWRGETFKQWPEAIDATVKLTHVIALLAYLVELETRGAAQ